MHWEPVPSPALRGDVVFMEYTETPRFDPLLELWILPEGSKQIQVYYMIGTGEELTKLDQDIAERGKVQVIRYRRPLEPEDIQVW